VKCIARDTNLQRDVALKILPEAMARDAQRMARFEREGLDNAPRTLICSRASEG
jgi:hypothetical protein